MKKVLFLAAFIGSAFNIAAQAPSKRGMCYNDFSDAEVQVLNKSRVTWAYNWYQDSNSDKVGPTKHVEFMPMIWGAGEDFDAMVAHTREYLSKNKGVKCILGFNEPMMKGQYGGCALTPKEAAKKWPVLEELAKEFNAELAGPALTWGFEPLSDKKIYGPPEAWLDEFIKEYKKKNKKREPRFDYVVLHSYMDYPQAVMWFCKTYAERYGKKVLLTEFCAWDQDQNQTPHQSLKEQTITMSQKVEAMDAEDFVAGYAWFLSHGATDTVPFNTVFLDRNSDGSLTDLGLVYLYMADVSKPQTFTTGKRIAAYEYASSSNYNKNAGKSCDDGSRFSTPVGLTGATDTSDAKIKSEIPLELGDFSNKRFANYKIDVPKSKKYKISLRILTDRPQEYAISSDGTLLVQKEIPSTGGKWQTVTLEADLTQGLHEIQIKTVGNARTAKFYWFIIE